MFLIKGLDSKALSSYHIFSVILQIAVPRHSVGVVIGRNGEMIKKIQSDAGVKIQFKPGELNCIISVHFTNEIQPLSWVAK